MTRALGIVLVSALLAGCGDDQAPSASDADTNFAHVHGLGVNPADGALFVATHTGLLRSPAGDRSAQRVGDSFQDTMGFTVVGENRFLGSGHPDARAGGPPLLGLIESHDAGKTWQPRIFAGEADFHVLRAAGGIIYAYDVVGKRLFHGSVDGSGLSLKAAPPGSLIDVAAEVDQPENLIAATDRGLYESLDAAGSWQLSRSARAARTRSMGPRTPVGPRRHQRRPRPPAARPPGTRSIGPSSQR